MALELTTNAEIALRQQRRLEEYRGLELQKQGQIIVPNLLLGPLQIAENVDDINNLGISAVLSVLGFLQNEIFSTGADVERKWICVEDRVEAETQMKLALPEATETIHTWIRDRNRVVYVHCQSGISRSATVVIAYLMKYHRLPLMDCYKIVHDARPVINPNDGFFRALQEFASTHCGVDYSIDIDLKSKELNLFNAYQLVSQLAFTGISLAEAIATLERKNGDIHSAASSILSRFEHS